MEGGSQKYATPTVPSKFGNPLGPKLQEAIVNPEITPTVIPGAPKQVIQGTPENFKFDLDPSNPTSNNNPDPRSLFGLKPGESYIPATEALELRKMANQATRFKSPAEMFGVDPQMAAGREQAFAAGNHIRGALAETDPALAAISDKLEDAYALRENAVGPQADKKPISTIIGTNPDKAQALERFDQAVGYDPKSGLRQLGRDVDLANTRAGNSRAAEMFGPYDPTSYHGLVKSVIDRIPRVYNSAAQTMSGALNPTTTMSQQLTNGLQNAKALWNPGNQ
jgi:hypothetical protein